jgi:hypothetical protein
LKSILVGLELVEVDLQGQIARNQPGRVHIDKLFGQFQAHLSGRRGATYAGLLPVYSPSPFHDWMVDHRYVADHQFSTEALKRWMWAALVVSKVLREAENNGDAQ